MDDIYKYGYKSIKEFYIYSLHDFCGKKFFWKNSNIFEKLVSTLSFIALHEDIEKRFITNLKISNIILKLIINMLTETETVDNREVILEVNQGRVLKELIYVNNIQIYYTLFI